MMNRNLDYKQKYKELKLKLKSLIYENETYQEQLKQSQSEYLRLTKDRDFLLDRLLAYENVSESDCTDAESEHELTNQKSTRRPETNINSTKKRRDNENAKKKSASVGSAKMKTLNDKLVNNLPNQPASIKKNVSKNDRKLSLMNGQLGCQANSSLSTKITTPQNSHKKGRTQSNDCLTSDYLSDEKAIDLASDFHFNQNKLMFNDDRKLMFNNDLNGELSDTRAIDLANTNLHLNGNLDNSTLNSNLTTNLFEV